MDANFEARFARVEGQLTEVVTAVGDLAASQAATTANVNALAQIVRDQRPKGINWGWLISAVVLGMAFIALYVDPVRASAQFTAQQVADLVEERARLARDVDWIKALMLDKYPD